MCCPFQYVNVWFDRQNVFKTHPVKWHLIYYGCALDIERYLACIPALVSNNSEYSLLTQVMADALCYFHSTIWLKVAQVPGFGPLWEPVVLRRGRGGVSCPPHQKILQRPAGRWDALADHARDSGSSMCLCHPHPSQWRLHDIPLSDLTWE